MADFIEGVRTILASIPYTQIAGRTDEAFFHTVFYLMLSAAGVQARSEVLSSRGRMDMAVEFEDKVFLIELQCNQDAERAIRQILDRKYYEAYANSGREIFLMGINFDAEERTLTDWRCRPLDEAR